MKELCLIMWFLLTIALVSTIIGMFLFIPSEGGRRSAWMEIGINLVNSVIKDN